MSEDVYDEIVQEFYGIDLVASKVDNVAITRGGKVSRWTDDKGYVIHQLAGSDPRAEIIRLFGLTDLVQVDPRSTHVERRQVIAALDAKILSNMISTALH